jgi:hypothetical protein
MLLQLPVRMLDIGAGTGTHANNTGNFFGNYRYRYSYNKNFEALTIGNDLYVWAISVPVPVHIFGKYGYRHTKKNT